MSSWKQRVAARFDAAAMTYASAARVQRMVAEDLAVRVSALPLPAPARVLEVGCGTGFLTAALVDALPAPEVLATDIAPSMVAATEALAMPGVTCRVMDGEHPDAPEAGFDLVTSSMAAQWFTRLSAAVDALFDRVRPGGYLALTTLGAETFHEWRDACRAAGITPHDRGYPTPDRFAELLGPGAEVDAISPVIASPSGAAFLRDLKAIGAHTRAEGQAPMTAGELRRVMRELEQMDGQVYTTYHVLFGIRRKP